MGGNSCPARKPVLRAPAIWPDRTGTSPVAWLSESNVARLISVVGLLLLVWVTGCKPQGDGHAVLTRSTLAELRVIKGQVGLTEEGNRSRAPHSRERLGDNTSLYLDADALSWMRLDSGAVILVRGPARLAIQKGTLSLTEGKLFVDTKGGSAVSIDTPRGRLEVAEGRTSVDLDAAGNVNAYALRGSVRLDTTRAISGEMLQASSGKAPERLRTTSWDDWTGGLATADPDAQPAPFGIGTVGARKPEDTGKPRFSLLIQRLEVRVTIDHDFAITEVDQTFANSSPDTVEGLFSFRVPENAVLHRFGVDRDGLLVWGRVKEQAQARAQYQANVYQGSTEDPALLEWVTRGVYQARLYPINAGASRRVVTRYGEWLARSGDHGERRLYVYPLAASGAEGTLPRIEEMTVRVDWSKAQASYVRAPAGSRKEGRALIIKGHDLLPKADLAVELFDSGQRELTVYRAPHVLTADDVPADTDAEFATKVTKEEPDYVLFSLPKAPPETAKPGADLAIVVDSSSATQPSALAVARSMVEALLTTLGPNDRVALWTGDTTLRPVLPESAQPTTMDATRRREWLAALANAPTGGATDIGTMLTEAAATIDGKRRGAVVYIGDGRPSVGELVPRTLRERLNRLPPTTRVLAVGVGTEVNRALLEGVVRGAPLRLISNGYEAAEAALSLMEATYQPGYRTATVELAGIDRILPNPLPQVAPGEPAVLVGRVRGPLGTQLTITEPGRSRTLPIRVVTLRDEGDLRRRWGGGRLAELMEQEAGRLALVDLARRYGLVTPLTSLYVATRREVEQATRGEELATEHHYSTRQERRARWKPWSVGAWFSSRESEDYESSPIMAKQSADNKEGGTGTRAKGEEGSMGAPTSRATNRRYAVQGPSDNPDPHVARSAALREAQEFGMIGLLNSNATADEAAKPSGAGANEPAMAKGRALPPPAAQEPPTSPPPTASASPSNAPVLPFGRDTSPEVAGRDTNSPTPAPDSGGLGLSSLGTTGAGKAVTATAPGGFGSGHGRLGGGHTRRPDAVSPASVTNRQPTQPPRPGLGTLIHVASPCSQASNLPLADRRKLWGERLVSAGTARPAYLVYQQAIDGCEAPSWRDRIVLLTLLVDRLPSVQDRVALLQILRGSPAAAQLVYRAILTRVDSQQALQQLYQALGIQQASSTMLETLLKETASPKERAEKLRRLLGAFPDDIELALRLLDAYEDAKDESALRSLARQLRKRADATSHLRTAVGELYLRLSAHGDPLMKEHDIAEARRTFGEIVEFAPEDPGARRRLGDLLRAHGWHEEAFRQYRTLKELSPDDPVVDLLVASALQGMGRTEEALRWAEKSASTAAPGSASDLEQASRAWASAFLSWAHKDAVEKGQNNEAERLLTRGRRLLSTGSPTPARRFILTWEHPELRPSLWLTTPDGALPARTMVLLGVAEGTSGEASGVEIRVDPEDVAQVARLGAEARLTVVTNEGTKEQSVLTQQIRFGTTDAPRTTIRVLVESGSLREEAL